MALMAGDSYQRAPLWRRTGAGLLDAAVFAGGSTRARRTGLVREGGLIERQLIPALPDVLREQLRMPGQLLFGIRTVDRRTGKRVALWRTFALAAVAATGRELVRRLAFPESPELDRERQAFNAEIHEIFRGHPQDSPEREAALREASARQRGLWPSAARAMGPSLLVGLLSSGLRRRLAPTVEVLAREGSDHRP